MEQASTSRPKLIRGKFNKISNKIHDNNNDDFPQNRGCKRKNSDSVSVGGKKQFIETIHAGGSNNRGGNKFSANARLMQYRKILDNKKNEVVKVHTLQKASLHENRTETVNQCSREATEGCFREKTPPVPAQKSSISRRLIVSTKEDCRPKTHTPLINSYSTIDGDCSRFETAASYQNSVKVSQQISANQRLKISTKEDYKSHTFSFASSSENEGCSRNFEAPTTSRQNSFAKVSPQNQHLNTSSNEDCRQKSHAFSSTPTTSFSSSENGSCSRNFENAFVKDNGVQCRLNTYKGSALTIEETSNNDVWENEDVDMDWSPITEEQLITDVC